MWITTLTKRCLQHCTQLLNPKETSNSKWYVTYQISSPTSTSTPLKEYLKRYENDGVRSNVYFNKDIEVKRMKRRMEQIRSLRPYNAIFEDDLESDKDKPSARTRDDPEVDNMLKERIRWGDPMTHLVKRKQPDDELALVNLGDDGKMKESGFLIPQDIPDHSWIERRMEAAPNRYGIPGRHWDGVDRSNNGAEEEFFKRMNEKQATEKEAYLWSVSDM